MPDINLPKDTYTLEDFIELRDSDTYTYYNLSLLFRSLDDEGIIYPLKNIVYDYLDELKAPAKRVRLTDNDFQKYKFKPKLLAYDLYGSTELYFILLVLNGTLNIKDFNKKLIYVLLPADLAQLINAIVLAESDYISANRQKLNLEESY